MPRNLTYIGKYAFLGCRGPAEVTIPSGVTNIGEGAFAYCENLTKVRFLGNAPNIGSDAFGNTPATIYYMPGTKGSTNAVPYRPTFPWPVDTKDAKMTP